MTLAELKKGLLSLMQTIFPLETYKYYSLSVVEGFQRPCFFTQIKPVDTDPLNYNSRNNLITFYINYFQNSVDEADILDTIDKLRNLFELDVKIGDRSIKTSSFEWDYLGTDRNSLEIQVDFQWTDRINHVVTEEMVETVTTKTEMEE